jgi:NhaP-type Na+/H+ and K+/H+ antiporter
MLDMSTKTRVVAVTREDAAVHLHPTRDTRLRAGDTVYLVGPYRELLATLRKGLPPKQPEQRPADGPQVDAAPEMKAG